MKTENQENPQKGKKSTDALLLLEQARLQLQNEIDDNYPNQLPLQLVQYRHSIQLLQRIFEVLPNELVKYPDVLPTSFVSVEKAIAQYISGCLVDVPEQNRSIDHILTLVRDYRVVQLVRDGNPTVSLDRVYTIVQDNYKDSYLCNLLNILLAGFMNTEPKVITFL